MNIEASRTASILSLQAALMEVSGDGAGIPDTTHVFAPGSYARTMIIPAGQIVVGKMHRHAHLNIISYGKICVATYEGVVKKEGHSVFVSPPDVKRCVYAEEDTCWTTIHLTEETDLEKIEADVIIKEGSDEFISKLRDLIGGDV